MKLNKIISAFVCFAVIHMSACKAVKENFGEGIDMTQQEQVNKIPGIIGKIIQPDTPLIEIGMDFKNSQSFTQEAKAVDIIKAEGTREVKISLNTGDSISSRSLEEFNWYKEMTRYPQTLSKFDFSKIAQYIADGIKQIDGNSYEYAGLGKYILKVGKGGISHEFDIQTTKKGESSKQTGRMITTNYYELNFEVTPGGKLINKTQ